MGDRECLQGWWHWPGRLGEALCCFSCLKQETLAAEPEKCFVIHSFPAGSSLGSPCVPHPTALGHTQSPAWGQSQALLFPKASLAEPALPILLWWWMLCSWGAKDGMPGLVLGLLFAFSFCCAEWKLICVPLELEATTALTSSGN